MQSKSPTVRTLLCRLISYKNKMKKPNKQKKNNQTKKANPFGNTTVFPSYFAVITLAGCRMDRELTSGTRIMMLLTDTVLVLTLEKFVTSRTVKFRHLCKQNELIASI